MIADTWLAAAVFGIQAARIRKKCTTSPIFAVHDDDGHRPKPWLSLQHQPHIHHVVGKEGGFEVAAQEVLKPDTAVVCPVAGRGREQPKQGRLRGGFFPTSRALDMAKPLGVRRVRLRSFRGVAALAAGPAAVGVVPV